jgi:hypothetical protein
MKKKTTIYLHQPDGRVRTYEAREIKRTGEEIVFIDILWKTITSVLPYTIEEEG